MNNTKEDLMETVKNNALKLSDTFRFGCDMCGECCKHRGGENAIILNPKDVYAISRKLKISNRKFLKKYCTIYLGDNSRFPIVTLNTSGPFHACVLLQVKKCSVHESKPVVCALFPIGRAIMNPEADTSLANKESIEEPISYFLGSEVDCGIPSDIRLKDWLDLFHIPYQDPFFIEYNDLHRKWAQKVKPLLESTPVPMLWDFVLEVSTSIVYEFEPGISFEDQYKNNFKKLELFMDVLVSDVTQFMKEAERNAENVSGGNV